MIIDKKLLGSILDEVCYDITITGAFTIFPVCILHLLYTNICSTRNSTFIKIKTQ